jgi:hypothetical protein
MKASFALFKNFLRGKKEGLAKMMANPLKIRSFICTKG